MQASRDDAFLFQSIVDEHQGPCQTRSGAIPEGLTGTLLRVGPGVQRLGDDVLAFFDGHTLVAGVTFEGGRAHARTRHARTPVFERETLAQKQLERRAFTNLPGWWANFFKLELGSSPLQDVLWLGGRLFAISEQGWLELDALTLETRGLLPLPVQRGPQDWLAFMPRLTADGQRLIAQVVVRKGLKPDTARFFELDGKLEVHREVSTTLQHNNAFVHEQAYTPRWHVQFEFPLKLKPFSVLAGKKTVADCFAREKKPCVLHLVPRDGGEPLRLDVPDGAGSIFHIANAWEEGETVIVDAVAEEVMPDFYSAEPDELRARNSRPDTKTPPGHLHRYTVDTRARTITARTLLPLVIEQSIVNRARFGLKHRYVYAATPGTAGGERDPMMFLNFHALARIDVDSCTHTQWDFGPRCFVGQPAFCARPGASDEDDGWVLTWVLDAARARTEVAIFDARDFAKGPIAQVDLGTLLPGYNHSRFYSEVRLSP